MKGNPKASSVQIMGVKITQKQIMYHTDYQTYDVTFTRGKRKATVRISVPLWGKYVGGHPEWGIVKAHEPLDKTQLLYAISQIVNAALGYIYLPAESLAERREDPRREPHKKLFRVFKDVDELRKFDAELEERLYEVGFPPSLPVRERLAAEERAEYEKEFAKRKREGRIYENPSKRKHAKTRIYNIYHRDNTTGEDKFVREMAALSDWQAIAQTVGQLKGWHWADANTYESPDGKECYWSWRAAKVSHIHKPEKLRRKEMRHNPRYYNNPKYGFARRHYQLVADILNEAGEAHTDPEARRAIIDIIGMFTEEFRRDNPNFSVHRFLNSAAEWMPLKDRMEAMIEYYGG